MSSLLSFDQAVPKLVIAGLIASAIYALYRRALPQPLPGIPYDVEASKSLAGDIATLKDDPNGLASWCAKHLTKLRTPVSQIMMGPFSKPIVLVADVSQARDIMSRSEFERSVYVIDRFPLFGGSQIRMHTNEQWKTSRNWLKDLLTPQYMQRVAGPAIHKSVRQLVELWDIKARLAGPDRPFCILQDMKDLALDVMTQYHHGDSSPSLSLSQQILLLQHESPVSVPSSSSSSPSGDLITHFPHASASPFAEGLIAIADRMAAIYIMLTPPWLVSLWTKHCLPRYRGHFSAKQSFMRERFSSAIAKLHSGEEPLNAIDHMVSREAKAAAKASRAPVYAGQMMVDEAFGNHIAGLHTTSSAMAWIVKFLTEHPDVQSKVRGELREVFPEAEREGRVPSCGEMMGTNLPYTAAVVEETMRLRAAFLITRDAVKDTEIMGYRIPKGTTCFLICQGVEEVADMARGKGEVQREYPGKEGKGIKGLGEFDPERWLVRGEGKEVRFDGSRNPQMAFGLGVRACWGRKVAELEMKMMTALVTWCFDILPTPEGLSGHDAMYDFAYRPKQGFVELRSRRKG